VKDEADYSDQTRCDRHPEGERRDDRPEPCKTQIASDNTKGPSSDATASIGDDCHNERSR
jgi:hypothetical protein